MKCRFKGEAYAAIGLAVGIGLLSTKVAAGVGIAAGLGAMFSGFGVLGLFDKRQDNYRVEIISTESKSEKKQGGFNLPGYKGNPYPPKV